MKRRSLTNDRLRAECRLPSDGEQSRAVGSIAKRAHERLVHRVQRRTATKHRHADLLGRRHVVHQLRVPVCECEPHIVQGQSPRGPRAIAVAHACDPGAAAIAPDRALTDDRRAHAPGHSREARRVARAFLQRQLELGAKGVVVPTRIRAGLQRRPVQDVAAEHGQRAGIVSTVHSVLEPPRRDPVDHDADLAVGTAAHGEVAAIVVDGCHSWHGVNRFERIALKRASRQPKGTAVERRLRCAAIHLLASIPRR